MADHYKLETKGGRIWLRNAKNQVDKGTRIISKEPMKEATKFEGEQIVCLDHFVFENSVLWMGGLEVFLSLFEFELEKWVLLIECTFAILCRHHFFFECD